MYIRHLIKNKLNISLNFYTDLTFYYGGSALKETSEKTDIRTQSI